MNIQEMAERIASSTKPTFSAVAPYETINDVAVEYGIPAFEDGQTEIWYMKSGFARDGLMGYDWLVKQGMLPDPKNLKNTHIFLGRIKEKNLNKIFTMMQGEEWSPAGEARNLIRKKGLRHTSMSVGDIVKIGSKVIIVDRAGFKKLN